MNWEKLQRIRANFLSNTQTSDYWEDEEALSLYDSTFAQRIGFKWETIVKDIPNSWLDSEHTPTIVEWGCGTAIATRKVIGQWAQSSLPKIFLSDRSPKAVSFSKTLIQQSFPNATVGQLSPQEIPTGKFGLLLSHLVNELNSDSLESLRKLITKAHWVVWVEAGNRESSQKLVDQREFLKEHFSIHAPCPHQKECGIKKDPTNWCHFFAPVPSEVFQSAFWRTFSEKLHIDLRSLSTSYFILHTTEKALPQAERILGRPRHFKGYYSFYSCGPGEISTRRFQKKDDPVVFRSLKKVQWKLSWPLID